MKKSEISPIFSEYLKKHKDILNKEWIKKMPKKTRKFLIAQQKEIKNKYGMKNK